MDLLKGRGSHVASTFKLLYRAIKQIPILTVILVAVAIAVFIYREVNREVLVVYPFSVPKQYADSGLTGEAMANRIADALDDIQTAAETSVRKDEIMRFSGSPLRPDIEIPGTGIGLQAVTHVMRAVFQVHPKHVSGEVIFFPPGEKLTRQSQVVVTFRVSDRRGRTRHDQVSTQALDPKVTAKRTAEAILAATNPYVLAVYQWGRGDEETAMATIRELLEAPPADKRQIVAAYTFWGNALRRQGNLPEAIAKFQKAIELDPKHAPAHLSWGAALGTQGKLPEAIAKFQKAIELDPNQPDSYTGWGLAFSSQGKLPEAIAKYQKAIELDPKYTFAYWRWGFVLRKQGKLPEAIDKYRKLIELDPKDARPYRRWGDVLYEQGKLPEAIAKYQEAIELDPKDGTAYVGWGNVLYDQGKLPEAITKYQKAIELDPKYARAYYHWGLALEELGRHAEAEVRFSKARELGFRG